MSDRFFPVETNSVLIHHESVEKSDQNYRRRRDSLSVFDPGVSLKDQELQIRHQPGIFAAPDHAFRGFCVYQF